MGQIYRVNFKLRRRGETALDQNRSELRSEDYDNDEELCLAVAAELLEMLKEDREFINERGGGDDDN